MPSFETVVLESQAHFSERLVYLDSDFFWQSISVKDYNLWQASQDTETDSA